jgi:endoglucanase
MNSRRKWLWLGLLLLLPVLAATPIAADQAAGDVFAVARALGRGINFGNALEAPREGAWGMELKEEYFAAVQKAGFQSVRIPIKWSAHAAAEAPYALERQFAERVDWAIEQALSRGLAAVINDHHYDEIYQDPDKHEARLVGIWRQIAERYKDKPDRLVFEFLNEPNGKLTDERWNRMLGPLLQVVRPTNPRRAIVIGPGDWSNVNNIGKLRLPADDRWLIATVHYYLPFQFTHQGASWAQGSNAWRGRTWTATPDQTKALADDFAKVGAWAEAERRPMYLGEFGAYEVADMNSRALWTAAVAREAEKHKMSWAYWEFGAGFGAYDRRAKQWREPLLRALLPAK